MFVRHRAQVTRAFSFFWRFWPRIIVQDYMTIGPGSLGPYGPGPFII